MNTSFGLPVDLMEGLMEALQSRLGGSSGRDLAALLGIEMDPDPMPRIQVVGIDVPFNDARAYYGPQTLDKMVGMSVEDLARHKSAFDTAAREQMLEEFEALLAWQARFESREQEKKAFELRVDDGAKLLGAVLRKLDPAARRDLDAMAERAFEKALYSALANQRFIELATAKIAESGLPETFAQAVLKAQFEARIDQRLMRWFAQQRANYKSFWDIYKRFREFDRLFARRILDAGSRKAENAVIEEHALKFFGKTAALRGWTFRHFFGYESVNDELDSLWRHKDTMDEIERKAAAHRLERLLNAAPAAIERYLKGEETPEDMELIEFLETEHEAVVVTLLHSISQPQWRESVKAFLLVGGENITEEHLLVLRAYAAVPENERERIAMELMFAEEVEPSDAVKAVMDASETIARVLRGEGTLEDDALLFELDDEVLNFVVRRDTTVDDWFDVLGKYLECGEDEDNLSIRDRMIYYAIPMEDQMFIVSHIAESSVEVEAEAPASEA